MFVDSTANVGNDRHRILMLAEKQIWEFEFPAALALWAGEVDSNGQGLQINLENGLPPTYYDVHDALHKGVDSGPPSVIPAAPAPSRACLASTARDLEKVARDQGTYFEGPTPERMLQCVPRQRELLRGGRLREEQHRRRPHRQAADRERGRPGIIVIDTPSKTTNLWNYRGDRDFWGILVTIGNSLQGYGGIHGAMYCHSCSRTTGTGIRGDPLQPEVITTSTGSS